MASCHLTISHWVYKCPGFQVFLQLIPFFFLQANAVAFLNGQQTSDKEVVYHFQGKTGQLHSLSKWFAAGKFWMNSSVYHLLASTFSKHLKLGRVEPCIIKVWNWEKIQQKQIVQSFFTRIFWRKFCTNYQWFLLCWKFCFWSSQNSLTILHSKILGKMVNNWYLNSTTWHRRVYYIPSLLQQALESMIKKILIELMINSQEVHEVLLILDWCSCWPSQVLSSTFVCFDF